MLARDPATHVCLDTPGVVGWLLNSLTEIGADGQVAALVERLPVAGLFDQFIKISDHRERFRYGREPDKSAAAYWTWDDLE